jgi:hypothetical protein
MLGSNAWAGMNCKVVKGTSEVQFLPPPWTPGIVTATGTIALETINRRGGYSYSGTTAITLLQLIPNADGSLQMIIRSDNDFSTEGTYAFVAYAVLTPTAVNEYTLNEKAMIISGTGDFADASGFATATGTADFNTGIASVNILGTLCNVK